MANINTLITDIHSMLEDGKQGFSERNLQEFYKALREDIENFLSPEERVRHGSLRMSSIGKHSRKLWYEFRDKTPSKLDGQTKLKLFFGNLVEAFLLFLAQEAGHKVTDRQKEVVVEGVKGHIDAKIDGVLVDVKSASDFGFRKFKFNDLEHDDPFGYIGQISGYVQAEGGDVGYFLAYNKNNAEMALVEIDELSMIDAKERIIELKKTMKEDTVPSKCYEDKAEGKQGNRILDKNCTYCDYKYECWEEANEGQGLRVFRYASGLTYFTHIEKEPKVDEVL